MRFGQRDGWRPVVGQRGQRGQCGREGACVVRAGVGQRGSYVLSVLWSEVSVLCCLSSSALGLQRHCTALLGFSGAFAICSRIIQEHGSI